MKEDLLSSHLGPQPRQLAQGTAHWTCMAKMLGENGWWFTNWQGGFVSLSQMLKMYGTSIFTYMNGWFFWVNVGKYTIHGWYGVVDENCRHLLVQPLWRICSSNGIISAGRGENKKCVKPPRSAGSWDVSSFKLTLYKVGPDQPVICSVK